MKPSGKLGQCKFYDRTPVDNYLEILKRIGDAQIVLKNKTPLNQNVLQAAPQIQYVGMTATGYNIVDIAAAQKAGITVLIFPLMVWTQSPNLPLLFY